MPKLKALFIKCPKATIPIFPTLENHHIFKITFFGLLTISRSILTPQTPTIYQKNGNYLRIQQKFSDLSYEVYARRYKLPNISHFFRTTPYDVIFKPTMTSHRFHKRFLPNSGYKSVTRQAKRLYLL